MAEQEIVEKEITAQEWAKEKKYWFCLVNLGVLCGMATRGSLYSDIPAGLKEINKWLEDSYKRTLRLPSYEFRLQREYYDMQSNLQKSALEEAFKLLGDNPEHFQRCVSFIQDIFQGRNSCLDLDSRSTITCNKCFYGINFQHLSDIKNALTQKHEEINKKK